MAALDTQVIKHSPLIVNVGPPCVVQVERTAGLAGIPLIHGNQSEVVCVHLEWIESRARPPLYVGVHSPRRDKQQRMQVLPAAVLVVNSGSVALEEWHLRGSS